MLSEENRTMIRPIFPNGCLVNLLHFVYSSSLIGRFKYDLSRTGWYGMLLDVTGINNNIKDYKSIPLLQWKDYKSIRLLQWKDYTSIPLLQWKAWNLYLSCLHDEMPTTKTHLANIYYLCDMFSLQRINQW
jgi:hypothetical protein